MGSSGRRGGVLDNDLPPAFGHDVLGAWIDLDNYEYLCELAGLNWAKHGLSDHNYGQGFDDLEDNILGEYMVELEMGGSTLPNENNMPKIPECCGDDFNERIAVGVCEVSNSDDLLCCPDDGLDYKVLDGVCIQADKCPDAERGPPVFVGQTNETLLASWNDHLLDYGDGYCCADFLDGGDLCDLVSSDGCFIGESSLPPHFPVSRKEYCQVEANDPYCLIDVEDSPIREICEYSNICNESKGDHPLVKGFDKIICDAYLFETSDFDCYPKMIDLDRGEDCNPIDPSKCEEVKESICTGQNCQAFCDFTKPNGNNNGGTGSFGSYSHADNCVEICEFYVCVDEITYRGAACNYPANCVADGEVCNTRVIVGDVNFNTCEIYGCEGTPWNKGSCSYPDYPTNLFFEDLVCEQGSFCLDGLNDCKGDDCLLCLQSTSANGESIFVEFNNGDRVSCSVDSENYYDYGDYWCPENFKFKDVLPIDGVGFCEREMAICDSGFSDNLEIGCDELFFPKNDFWGLYDSQCISAIIKADIPDHTYDSACCYQSSFNGFDLYQDDAEYLDVPTVQVY